MKTFKTLLALGVVGLAASGCAKKSSNNNDSSKPAPKVEIVKQAPQYGQGFAVIKANSNLDTATFKCQTITTDLATSQSITGEWIECDPKTGYQVTMLEGMNYVVNVKATAGGKDSAVETFVLVPGQGQGQGQGSVTQQGDFRAVILNKQDVASTVTTEVILFKFGIEGVDAAISDVQFECKRDLEPEYRACDPSYPFEDLQSGAQHSLAVRASLDGQLSLEDSVQFEVELSGIELRGKDQLQNPTANGRINMDIVGNLQGKQVSCFLNQQPIDCSQGQIAIDINGQLARGMQSLFIEVKDASGTSYLNEDLSFCAAQCPGPNGGIDERVERAPIGSQFEINIPETMHIAVSANAANYGGGISYFQVTNDQFYLGTDLCGQDDPRDLFDDGLGSNRNFQMTFTDGISFNYCKETFRENVLHWLTERRMGVNHLELSTNQEHIGIYGHERILINQFEDRFTTNDFALEWNFTRSRFHEICSYGRVSVSPIKVELVNSFFWDNEYTAYVMQCITPMVGVSDSGSPFPQSQDWQVGGFFVVKNELPWGCFGSGYRAQTCGSYSSKSVLEVVYMSNRIQSDYGFVRTVQQRLLQDAGLRATQP